VPRKPRAAPGTKVLTNYHSNGSIMGEEETIPSVTIQTQAMEGPMDDTSKSGTAVAAWHHNMIITVTCPVSQNTNLHRQRNL
jgi:hypothetical protein